MKYAISIYKIARNSTLDGVQNGVKNTYKYVSLRASFFGLFRIFKHIIVKNTYVLACIFVMGYFNVAAAQNTTDGRDDAQRSGPSQQDNATTSDEAEAGNGEGVDEIDTSAIRRSVPASSNAPVASAEWANAGFVGFLDVDQRLAAPDPDLVERGLRLLTTDDLPRFNERDETGAPSGYHVDLARAMCEELNTACTIKLVPFDQIPDLIAQGKADAALAGLVNHPSLQDRLEFSSVYLQRPARFVHRMDTALQTSAEALASTPVAVKGGTAHEAYLRAYFPYVNRVPVVDLQEAVPLLAEGKVQAIFGDAFQLLPLVTARDSAMTFAGKPYYDRHFFGDGMAIAVGRNEAGLRRMINFGLLRLAQKGRMAELYAMHFGVDVYGSY